MEALMKNAADFLRAVKKDDDVVIVFNNDGDGTSACVVMMKFLESRGIGKPLIISQPMPVEKNLIRKIQTTVPDKIIFLDLAIDQQLDVVKKIGGLCDILVIDHHTVHKNLNSPHIVHYNPRFKKPEIYQSASYCTYKVCSLVEDMDEWLWVAAVGAVSDYNLDDSQDLVEAARKKYKIVGKLYDSFLGRLADMISASKASDTLTCENMAEIFASITDPKDLEALPEEMKRAHREVGKELAMISADMESGLEIHGNLVLYRIVSRYSLRSPVSTRLGERFKDKMVIVWEQMGSKVKISSRNQSGRYDTGRLLQEAANGLTASAGGHGAASGGVVAAVDWEKFKDRLIKLVNKS